MVFETHSNMLTYYITSLRRSCSSQGGVLESGVINQILLGFVLRVTDTHMFLILTNYVYSFIELLLLRSHCDLAAVDGARARIGV